MVMSGDRFVFSRQGETFSLVLQSAFVLKNPCLASWAATVLCELRKSVSSSLSVYTSACCLLRIALKMVVKRWETCESV